MTCEYAIKVSVIIPIYKCETYVKRLVNSLNKQIFTDFEAIFINDCTPDNSFLELKKELTNSSFQYQLIDLDKNAGPGNARNVGMRYAQGEYFSFIDSDDYVSDNYLSELYNSAKKDNADIAIAQMIKIWTDGTVKIHKDISAYKNHLQDKTYLTCLLDFGPCAKLIRHSLWDENECGFPGRIIGEDGATMPVIFNKAEKFTCAENAIYYYYQTPVSRSRNAGSGYNDVFKACQILEKRIDNPTIVEFKYVLLVGYGVIMNAMRANAPKSEIKKYYDFLKRNYPSGRNNPYYKYIPRPKRIFILLSYLRFSALQRLMVKLFKR